MTEKQLIIRIPEKLHRRFRHYAIDADVSMNGVVNMLIEKYLWKERDDSEGIVPPKGEKS